MRIILLIVLSSIHSFSNAQLPTIQKWFTDSLGNKKSTSERFETDSLGNIHGELYSYYVDGSLKAKGWYVHGVEHGIFTEYICIFPTSTKLMYQRRYTMKNGKAHGAYIEQSMKGSVLTKGKFKNGQKHGSWTIGASDMGKVFFSEGRYRNGKRVGRWTNLQYYSDEQYEVGVDVGIVNLLRYEPYTFLEIQGYASYFSKNGDFIKCMSE